VADSTGGKINKGIVSKMDTQGLKKTTLKDVLKIGEYELSSRLLVGTGKYKDLSESHAAIEASGAAAVTVAIRRMNLDRLLMPQICWMSFLRKNTLSYLIQQVVMMPLRR